jgi:hypothetical protein
MRRRQFRLLLPFLALSAGFHAPPPLHARRLSTRTRHSSFGPGWVEETRKRDASEVYMSPSEDPADTDLDELIEGRKIVTMVGYRVPALIYLFLGFFLMIWHGARNPMSLPLTCFVAAGPILAAGVSYVLEGAAVNDRLGSDYKRLNLYLGQYGALWLTATFFARATKSKTLSNPFILTAALITAINGFKAWTYGVKGWEKSSEESRWRDLITGIKKSFDILLIVKNLSGVVYFCATALVGFLKINELKNLLIMAFGGSRTGATIANCIFRYEMYALLAAVLFTLKDAAGKANIFQSRIFRFCVFNTNTLLFCSEKIAIA